MIETPGKVFALAAVSSILPILAVALRIHSRRKLKLQLSWDDWVIVFALVRSQTSISRCKPHSTQVATIALAILMIVGMLSRGGAPLRGTMLIEMVGAAAGNLAGHIRMSPQGIIVDERQQINYLVNTHYKVNAHEETEISKTTYANTVVQLLALGPTKLSVLLFYRRIFKGRLFDVCSLSLIAVVVTWTVAFFFTNLLVCVPIQSRISTLAAAESGSTCMDLLSMYLAQSYADSSIDVLILLLPIPMSRLLRYPTPLKLL